MDCVEVPGPPFVMAMIWSNTMRKFFTQSTMLMVKNGAISGKVIFQKVVHLPAPSMLLAS